MKTRNLNIDLEKFIIYRNKELSSFIGVEMKYQNRMIELYRKYNGFNNVPVIETIDGYLLVPELGNSWSLDLSNMINFKINVLEGTIIPIMK